MGKSESGKKFTVTGDGKNPYTFFGNIACRGINIVKRKVKSYYQNPIVTSEVINTVG